mmetsp:Transcript_34282/g.54932  ORF Transcript_34282/g.54932 Transcript_34282/m.54932 type:complete len:541 (-) Transcript_34282:938-2560(-)
MRGGGALGALEKVTDDELHSGRVHHRFLDHFGTRRGKREARGSALGGLHDEFAHPNRAAVELFVYVPQCLAGARLVNSTLDARVSVHLVSINVRSGGRVADRAFDSFDRIRESHGRAHVGGGGVDSCRGGDLGESGGSSDVARVAPGIHGLLERTHLSGQSSAQEVFHHALHGAVGPVVEALGGHTGVDVEERLDQQVTGRTGRVLSLDIGGDAVVEDRPLAAVLRVGGAGGQVDGDGVSVSKRCLRINHLDLVTNDGQLRHHNGFLLALTRLERRHDLHVDVRDVRGLCSVVSSALVGARIHRLTVGVGGAHVLGRAVVPVRVANSGGVLLRCLVQIRQNSHNRDVVLHHLGLDLGACAGLGGGVGGHPAVSCAACGLFELGTHEFLASKVRGEQVKVRLAGAVDVGDALDAGVDERVVQRLVCRRGGSIPDASLSNLHGFRVGQRRADVRGGSVRARGGGNAGEAGRNNSSGRSGAHDGRLVHGPGSSTRDLGVSPHLSRSDQRERLQERSLCSAVVVVVGREGGGLGGVEDVLQQCG